MKGGVKRHGGVDESQLVAESWAELALNDREEGASFSPYREYQIAKGKGQRKHEKQSAFKPAEYKAKGQVTIEIAPQPAAERLEDVQKMGSFNPHHQRAIKKMR